MPSNRRDIAKGITDEAKGRVKDAVGKATGNRRLQAEGKMDQAKGKVHKASGRVKRAARDVGQAVDIWTTVAPATLKAERGDDLALSASLVSLVAASGR